MRASGSVRSLLYWTVTGSTPARHEPTTHWVRARSSIGMPSAATSVALAGQAAGSRGEGDRDDGALVPRALLAVLEAGRADGLVLRSGGRAPEARVAVVVGAVRRPAVRAEAQRVAAVVGLDDDRALVRGVTAQGRRLARGVHLEVRAARAVATGDRRLHVRREVRCLQARGLRGELESGGGVLAVVEPAIAVGDLRVGAPALVDGDRVSDRVPVPSVGVPEHHERAVGARGEPGPGHVDHLVDEVLGLGRRSPCPWRRWSASPGSRPAVLER